MLDYADVSAAISPEHVPQDEPDIELPRIDQSRGLAVGRDGRRAFVLVGPGQPTAQPLEGGRYRFDPWTQLVDRRSSAVLKDVCVLRFRADEELVVRDAVAAVFAGLVELASSAPDALGAAIEAMQALFESGLQSSLARDAEIGLAGELLAIAEAADPTPLAQTWHAQPEDPFDFSTQGERLEVKTTTAADRVHWFASGQVSPIPGVCTSFVSIQLPLVEVGSTVASVYADLTQLARAEKAGVRSRIIAVAKEPPEVLTSVVFDRDAARASMLHVAADDVPRPTQARGVGRMRWEATLTADSSGPNRPCWFSQVLGH
jgi:hypothetical protein